jgi:hypothetical protein
MDRAPNAFVTPFVPSADLAEIVGSAPRPKTVVLQAVMKYVQANGLQDAANPQVFRTDEKLQKICAGKGTVSIFELPGLINVQLSLSQSREISGKMDGESRMAAKTNDDGASWRSPAVADLITRLEKVWADSAADYELTPFKPEALADVKVDAQTRAVLIQLGLPDTAAPFLSFETPWEGALPRVSDPNHDGRYEQEGMEHMRIIGSDGAGNPICIDERKKGRIVLLDHESSEATPMNTSVANLLECLAAYADWHSEVREELGADAWHDTLPTKFTAKLEKALEGIDPGSYKAGSFWHTEVRGN